MKTITSDTHHLLLPSLARVQDKTRELTAKLSSLNFMGSVGLRLLLIGRASHSGQPSS